MKVLILSVTAGYGHHAAARAMERALLERGAEVSFVDVIQTVSKLLYKTVDKGYSVSTKLTPRQFGSMYRSILKDGSMRRTLGYIIKSKHFSKKTIPLLCDEHPDFILSTHVLGSILADKSILSASPRPRHIGIMTDYTLHPYWEDVKSLEKLTVCGEAVIPRAVRRGIPSDIVMPVGIPVDDRFLRSIPAEEARCALGINPSLPTVLIMSGSMGFGDMASTVSRVTSIKTPLQILCVCGKNRKLKRALDVMRHSVPVFIYGFVDNVDVMMDAADVVVTKPGGLSTTEALVKGKPLILTAPIPGMEEENLAYLQNLGLAMHATRSSPVHELVSLLLTTPGLPEQMREAIRRHIRPNAAQALCDYMFNDQSML